MDLPAIGRAILDKARDLLQGETARAIGYGAGLAVYFVARASGAVDDVPLDVALTATAAYVTVVAGVVESIRHFVYSPKTAGDLLDMISDLEDQLEDLRDQYEGPDEFGAGTDDIPEGEPSA